MVGVAKTVKHKRSRLEELSIKNLGVIEAASVEFAPGLNVLTGETGAGKTMVITALSLVMGSKSDADLVRTGSERLTVTGRFQLPDPTSTKLAELLAEHEPELEAGSILLTRVIGKDGKSKANLAGVPATASVLTQFSTELIEIHGQHGALGLLKSSRQRDLLDQSCGATALTALEKYRKNLEVFREIKRRVLDLTRSHDSRKEKIAELELLSSEFSKIAPKRDELEILDNRIALLEGTEEIRTSLTEILSYLSEEEAGIVTGLNRARKAAANLAGRISTFTSAQNRIENAFYDLSDLANEFSNYLDDLAADPAELEKSLTRRAALRSFAKKFGGDGEIAEQLERAIERGKAAAQEIQDLTGGTERVTQLQEELAKARMELLRDGESLSQIRIAGATVFAKSVSDELRDLAMPGAQFVCEVRPVLPSNDEFSDFGIDQVEMKFSAHSGGELLPISKAASGGELSRLMLAIEVVAVDQAPLGTYLFDEVDAGIGGKAALEVGKRLKRLAKIAQVIVVTHLPQVAIWADQHLVVNKDSSGAISESSITVLTGEARENEIARMLSGLSESEHAQEHARELLNLGKAHIE
jgi:DNA repair protein RecN (Recombination protein N)